MKGRRSCSIRYLVGFFLSSLKHFTRVVWNRWCFYDIRTSQKKKKERKVIRHRQVSLKWGASWHYARHVWRISVHLNFTTPFLQQVTAAQKGHCRLIVQHTLGTRGGLLHNGSSSHCGANIQTAAHNIGDRYSSKETKSLSNDFSNAYVRNSWQVSNNFIETCGILALNRRPLVTQADQLAPKARKPITRSRIDEDYDRYYVMAKGLTEQQRRILSFLRKGRGRVRGGSHYDLIDHRFHSSESFTKRRAATRLCFPCVYRRRFRMISP